MKVGIYTGAFNPFHNGHKEVIIKSFSSLCLDIIYIAIDDDTKYKQNASYEFRRSIIEKSCIGCRICIIKTKELILKDFSEFQTYYILGSDNIVRLLNEGKDKSLKISNKR